MVCLKCKKQIDEEDLFCRYCGKKQVATPRPTRRRPRGSGTVTKLPGNRSKPYAARKGVGGHEILIGTYATKTEALIALEHAQLHDINLIHEYTVDQFFNLLLEQNKDKLTKSGLTNYKSGYLYLQHLGKVKMKNIRTAHIQDAIKRAQEQGRGHATWKKIQNVASLMCKLAMANDVIDKNYAQLVSMPESKKKTDKTSFTDKQLDILWKASESDRIAAGILALCYNGMRINEFLDLKKEHVDLSEQMIFAPGSKTDAGKNRLIAIPEDLIPIYERMMRTPGEYLFSSPTNQRWDAKNFRERAFYPTLDHLGLNPDKSITPHSCRHTYAALCVKNELNEKATMDLLGHTKYSTTLEIYADATAKDREFLRREANKLRRQTER